MATLNIQIHQLFVKLGLIPLHGKILCPTSEELLNLDHAYLWIHAKALYQEQIWEIGLFSLLVNTTKTVKGHSILKFLIESVHDSRINGWKMPPHICGLTVRTFPYCTGFCSYCFEWLPRLQEHYSVFQLFIRNRFQFLLTLNITLLFS